MRFAFVFAFGLTVSVAWAQKTSPSFSNDPRLQAPITMRLKIVSLADFTEQLHKQTKVKISAADDVADRKITIIFHDRSTAEAMSAVQEAMFMEWKRVGDGYRLFLPLTVDREEKDVLAAENDILKKGLLVGLEHYASLSALPKEELERRIAAHKAQLAQMQQNSGPDSQREQAAFREEGYALRSTAGQGIAGAFSGDLERALDELLDGKTLCASTRSEDPVPKLPTGFMERLPGRTPDAISAIVMMRLNEGEQALQGRCCLASSQLNQGNTVTGLFRYIPRLQVKESKQNPKLLNRLKQWQQGADTSVLGKQFTLPGITEDKPSYFSRGAGGFTLAEHLEYIADHADIPVVGDAFRIYCSGQLYFPSATVQAYVDALKESKHMAGSLNPPVVTYVTARRGWLMARHQAYWRNLQSEIPESVLAPIENAAQASDYPSIDDYASFASNLRQSEASAMQYSTMDSAYRFDPLPLQKIMGSLQLWATLSPAAKEAAQSGGYSLTNLNAQQTQIVINGWGQKMWNGELPAGIWTSFLSPRGITNARPILKWRKFDFVPHPSPSGVVRSPRRARAAMQLGDFEYDLGADVHIHDSFVVRKARD